VQDVPLEALFNFIFIPLRELQGEKSQIEVLNKKE